jgi:hypothetical protein
MEQLGRFLAEACQDTLVVRGDNRSYLILPFWAQVRGNYHASANITSVLGFTHIAMHPGKSQEKVRYLITMWGREK